MGDNLLLFTEPNPLKMFVFLLHNTFKNFENNMKKIIVIIACMGMASTFLSSCIVSKKKYLAATSRADREHSDNVALTKQLQNVTDLANRQAKDIHQQKSTIDGLNDQIAGLNSNISDLQDKLSKLGTENQSNTEELNSKKAEIAAQRKKLEQLQAFIDQQQKATESLRKKIADALQGFNSNELTITRKNGKVYISMQEGLLFPSGSAVVNPKGKDALSKVASVLNTNSDINIDIEGHTDSLPIHTKQYADNWSLSTARATSIAHVLIDEYHVYPAKLVASGRSEYDPVATNSTPEGRAANRRTDIILEPKLDELMQMLNGK